MPSGTDGEPVRGEGRGGGEAPLVKGQTGVMNACQQQLLRSDAASEVPLVHFARNRQRCHGRDFASIVFNPFEHWGLSPRRTGRRHLFSKGEAEFVLNDDRGAVPPRFFYPCLILAEPGADQVFIPFQGAGLGFLDAPAQLLHQPADY